MSRQSPGLKLVALCSTAVLTVAGFSAAVTARTVPSHAQIGRGTNMAAKKHPAIAHHQALAKKPTPIAQQKYKDGTYTGIGQTQIGAVEVSVSLKKDKITRVEIIASSTHYPISYINPILPQQLVQRQDINKIDVISGATLSTADFYYAVVNALRKAKHA